jgi:hypothetical protein
MTYKFSTSFGDGVILAPCLQQLCAEIAAHPEYCNLTNLGEIGDSTHQGQGVGSDHNPFVVHNGTGYVRAIDLGGDRALLLQLRSKLFALYRDHDPRVYPYGYFKGPDSLINDWPPGTGWHTDTGDEGHLHISVTQRDGGNPSTGGWVAALDSRAPWGITDTPEAFMVTAADEAKIRAIVRSEIVDAFKDYTRDDSDPAGQSPGHYMKTIVSNEVRQAIPAIAKATADAVKAGQ